jgi:UDP-2,3-diacylglucosamine pyrophosphatase LpxH
VRALVISDTHFGAWTGEDLLRHDHELGLLARHLDDVDEVVFLGDLFDFLFSSVRDAVAASEGLLSLLREKLQGKRLVFLAGNHDHHLIAQYAEALRDLEVTTGESSPRLRDQVSRQLWFRQFLERRLDGVEIDLRYPTYTVGGVLCTHGHYLDYHAHRHGSLPNRLLGRALWSIACGGARTQTPSIEDYEAVITMLTELLYTIAQLPHGTAAQQGVFGALQRAERIAQGAGAPARVVKQLAGRVARQREPRDSSGQRAGSGEQQATLQQYDHDLRRARERRREAQPLSGGGTAGYGLARVVAPSDPTGPALDAIAQVVENLGWAHDTDKIVFAHTHQPLDDVTPQVGARVRYWNTGSWIYEPDLSSHEAYLAYLRKAWPGTAVLIDSDEPAPRLLEIRRHLSPLERSQAPS